MDTPKSRSMRHEDPVKLPFFVRFLETQRRHHAGHDGPDGPAQDAADGDHAALKCSSERTERDVG